VGLCESHRVMSTAPEYDERHRCVGYVVRKRIVECFYCATRRIYNRIVSTVLYNVTVRLSVPRMRHLSSNSISLRISLTELQKELAVDIIYSLIYFAITKMTLV